ncbi:shikimate kinase [Candidatus Riesia sp. GBBU]|nr:shikimate kinase [Candidatus Riesia sp. GBBU]ARC55079.1 shikimate kinase [Candidatus Riesia sp. GBBU]
MIVKRNIFLIGPMGSGKSTIGKQLSKKLNMNFFDSDKEIEKKTGVNVSWIFDVEGEKGFRKREKKIICSIVKNNNIVLATGGGSIESKKVRDSLSSRGVVIYLKTSIEKQIIRIKSNKGRPLLQDNKSTYRILKNFAYTRNPIYKEISDLAILTDDCNIKEIISKILDFVN